MGSDTVKRIDLPSGGWWDLETRPRLRHVRLIGDLVARIPGALDELDGGDLNGMGAAAIGRMTGGFESLIVLTDGWSYPEPVSVVSLDDLELDDPRIEDLTAVMQVFVDEVIPFLEKSLSSLNPKPSMSR